MSTSIDADAARDAYMTYTSLTFPWVAYSPRYASPPDVDMLLLPIFDDASHINARHKYPGHFHQCNALFYHANAGACIQNMAEAIRIMDFAGWPFSFSLKLHIGCRHLLWAFGNIKYDDITMLYHYYYKGLKWQHYDTAFWSAILLK